MRILNPRAARWSMRGTQVVDDVEKQLITNSDPEHDFMAPPLALQQHFHDPRPWNKARLSRLLRHSIATNKQSARRLLDFL